MSQENEAMDKVLSYFVTEDGQSLDREAVETAISDGYRVIDVLPVATQPGGAGKYGGGVCVTVVLSKEGNSPYYFLKKNAT